MRFAFLIATPFQFLNCINFVWHDMEGSRGNGDLYIREDTIFANYSDAIEKLKRDKVFANIYLYNVPERPKGWGSLIAYYITRALEYLIPKKAMHHYAKEGVDQKDYYDVIMATACNYLLCSLMDLNKNAKFWLLDDGTSSYYGGFREISTTKITKLFLRSFKRGAISVGSRVKRLYVNNKEMCRSTASEEILQLPASDHAERAYTDYLDELFNGPEADSFLERRYIFLSQPWDEILVPPTNGSTKMDLRTVLDYLAEHHKGETIVRKHPREKDTDFGELEVSKWNSIWELFCQKSLRDDQYLIGIYSTAQVSPKMFFNKEPHLIFLYELVSCVEISDFERQERDNLVQLIRDSYEDKSKVCVPKTMQEFVACIEGAGDEGDMS